MLKMSCMVVPIAFLKRQLNFSIKYDPGGHGIHYASNGYMLSSLMLTDAV